MFLCGDPSDVCWLWSCCRRSVRAIEVAAGDGLAHWRC